MMADCIWVEPNVQGDWRLLALAQYLFQRNDLYPIKIPQDGRKSFFWKVIKSAKNHLNFYILLFIPQTVGKKSDSRSKSVLVRCKRRVASVGVEERTERKTTILMLQSTINRRNLNFIRLCTPDPWKLYLVFGGSDYHPPSSWVSFCGG